MGFRRILFKKLGRSETKVVFRRFLHKKHGVVLKTKNMPKTSDLYRDTRLSEHTVENDQLLSYRVPNTERSGSPWWEMAACDGSFPAMWC